MTIKDGHEVNYEGEISTVLKIYPSQGLMQSALLFKSMHGKRLIMAAMNLLKK